MIPHIYDLESGEITDLDKFLKKLAQRSSNLMQLNYSYLKILKLKSHSLFGHAFLCPCCLMTRFYYLSYSCFFSHLLSHKAKSPVYAVGFFEKHPELTEGQKWPPFAKTRLSGEETCLQA